MQQNREQPQRNKQIIFIIVVYLFLTISSHISSNIPAFNEEIIQKINNHTETLQPPHQLLNIFSVSNYQGNWKCPNNNCLLNQAEGKASMKFIKFGTTQNPQYQVEFKVNNGVYIDNGSILFILSFNKDKLVSIRNSTSIVLTISEHLSKSQEQTKTPETQLYMNHEVKLRTITEANLYIGKITLNVTSISQASTPIISFGLSASTSKEQQQKQPLIQMEIQIQKKQSKMASIFIFALLLIALSLFQFTAIMQMIKAVLEGSEDPNNYSVLTMLIAIMWDAVICVIAFASAFRNEVNHYLFKESLVLFILPAFMLCLLFTNLELRLLLIIFQAKSNSDNNRQVNCYFNLITYGSLILLYPILLYTNLTSMFFILISLIFLPQIYENAKLGKRPNITNAYYSKFLPIRFFIILYLKCFPWNVFQLQPNYLLGFFCAVLVTLQIMILWVQKVYGPKTVIPSFMLPPVFNYSCQIEMNVEQGSDEGQCAICLAPLITDVDSTGNNLNVPFRLMRGPCGHRFHGTCLSQWMQIKMECPQCRSKLPPFQ